MKLGPCDSAPAHPQTDSRPFVNGETATSVSVRANAEGPTTAVEAVRYLFLAKELRRLGQTHAADRWQAKAMSWLERLSEPSDD